ncbi:flippase-like domain-containing protein [Candidatus Poribacteria bacterium]|nr:flippase-like domain-containing protein [Candidatus Poribacteria bacterium]
MKKIKVFLFALGLLLLALFIRKLGLENIWSNLKTLGWKFGLILGLSASWHCLNTIAWKLALVETQYKSRFRHLFCARLAGEAVNCITPIVNLGGELLKAYLLRNQISLPDGIVSVVIDRTVHTLNGVAFVSFGIGLAITWLSIPIAVKIALICSISLYAIGAVLGVIMQQRKPVSALHGIVFIIILILVLVKKMTKRKRKISHHGYK